MKYSGIGGQAVIEGVMMKNKEKYAVAVRKPDHEIEVMVSEYTGITKNAKIKNMPILRGVFNFIDSLVLGMQTLTYSASFFEEEEATDKKVDAKKANAMEENQSNLLYAIDTNRKAVSGVDEDEEGADLITFQNMLSHQYKVLSVLNQVLDKLINETI